MSEDEKPNGGYPAKPIETAIEKVAAATNDNSAVPQRNAHGHFVPGNTLAKGKRIKLGKAMIIGANDTNPMYKKFLARGRRWAQERKVEYDDTYGEVSRGVVMLLENAGYMLALSRYFDYLAREAPDQIVTGTELFKKAVSFIQEHRQLELQAHNIAIGENKVKKSKRQGNHALLIPMTTTKKDPTP